MTVPLGIHEFTATWSDGSTVTRRVYVPQMKVRYDVDYSTDVGRSSGKVQFAGTPDVEPTAVVLEKSAAGD